MGTPKSRAMVPGVVIMALSTGWGEGKGVMGLCTETPGGLLGQNQFGQEVHEKSGFARLGVTANQ